MLFPCVGVLFLQVFFFFLNAYSYSTMSACQKYAEPMVE